VTVVDGMGEDGGRVPASAPFVGREAESEVVDRLIDRVGAEGGALLVRGEPGIGKSELLARAARRAAERERLVLRAAGVQPESRMPFAGLHQLLRPVLHRADALSTVQRDAVRAALGASDAQAPDVYLIALATLELLSDAAADTPIVAIAEDAQWLDPATCDVLAFVGRRLESEPVALLVSGWDGLEGR
jgi:predicted ATPase